jgi:nitroimidazol reductase NimA-like FMN-containing flavoprotein (pyridoxamine 5'-phosphate oxidase superfamily)
MRRRKQQLTEEECIAILQAAPRGTLSVIGDNGYPYGVPINFVYADGKLYFHSALTGHKIDAVNSCSKASFTVLDNGEKPDEFFRSYPKGSSSADGLLPTIRIPYP